MGGVTDFLFGKPSKETSSSTNSSSSSSSNQAYNPLLAALGPTLNYGSQAGSAMAQLLGLPSYSPQPAPAPSPVPAPAPTPTPAPTYGGTPTYGGGSQQPYLPPQFQGTGGVGGDSAGPFQLKPTWGDIRARAYDMQDQAQAQAQSPQSYQTAPVAAQTPLVAPNPGSATTPGQSTAGLDSFASSGGMDFLRNQGVRAIEASQAGKGMLQSGATGQALSTFGNNLGKTFLNDYLNHLNDYASIGTKNAGVLSAAGQQSSSTGFGSSSGSGTGSKNGLLNTLAGNSGLGSVIAAFA